MRICTRIDYMDGETPEYYSVGKIYKAEKKEVTSIALTSRRGDDPTPDTYDVHFQDGTCVIVYNVERAFFSADDDK